MEKESDSNLIINYLPQTMTDTQFQNLFDSIGPTKSCRIIRDKQTNYSFGYGFVEYNEAKHAELAISTLNGYKIQHKTLKVSYSRPGGEKIKNTNLFISNLPKSIDEHQLEEIFKKYGNVIQSRILKDASGEPRGAGFIRYNLHDEAMLALNSMNGQKLPDSDTPLIIKLTVDSDRRQREIMQKASRMNYGEDHSGGGFGIEAAAALLSRNPLAAANMVADQMFAYGGYPADPYYGGPPRYPPGGRMPKMPGVGGFRGPGPKGPRHPGYGPPPPYAGMYDGGYDPYEFMYGMTSYSDVMTAYPPNPYATGAANGGLNGPGSGYYNNSPGGGKMMPGKRGAAAKLNAMPYKYDVRPGANKNGTAMGKGNQGGATGSNLFVYNIGNMTTEKEIISLFWPYGTVLKVDIPSDPKSTTGGTRGYAFVTMSTVDEANLAIQYLNNFAFKDKPLQVSLKKD